MKKIIFLIFIFFIFFLTYATAEELIPIDAVLVLDVSLSMKTADPERISLDAMNLFVEKLTENRDRVGVIAYAGRIERQIGLTELQTPEEREKLRDFINSLDYASWTDHGVGLAEAMRMLNETADDRQGVIIFLTDGNMNINPWGERTNENAQRDVNDAVAAARAANIPIHTIGLNFDGSLAVEYINEIAAATNGLAFETANAADIPEIIAAFFYAMIAAPVPQIYETKPIPEPVPTQPEEKIFSKKNYPEQKTPMDSGDNFFFAIGILVFVALCFAGFFARKTKRVFTGKLEIEINGRRFTKNLIEYGSRVTLSELAEAAPNSVILTPSPTAPSHLPQLQIKCGDPRVTFTKDFLEHDISRGFSIAAGTDTEIKTDEIKIRLRYLI